MDLLFYLCTFFIFFFFSSRRRHTRSKRDWSSDVCSSDLTQRSRRLVGVLHRHRDALGPKRGAGFVAYLDLKPAVGRSEERRVGKECRCRWSGEYERKKRGSGRWEGVGQVI